VLIILFALWENQCSRSSAISNNNIPNNPAHLIPQSIHYFDDLVGLDCSKRIYNVLIAKADAQFNIGDRHEIG